MKKWGLGCLLAGCLLLTGCTAGTDWMVLPESLYAPAADVLQAYTRSGAELCAPETGETGAVQRVDLDGDGTHEYLICLKNEAQGRLRVLLLDGDGETYRETGATEGLGTGIARLQYGDFTGDGKMLLLVSWKLGDGGPVGVSLCEPDGETLRTLYEGTADAAWLADPNEDGRQELLLCDTAEAQARLYGEQAGNLRELASAPLSEGLVYAGQLLSGSFGDGTQGFALDSVTSDGDMLTDVLVWEEDTLRNLTYDPEKGYSVSTRRAYAIPSQLRDNVLCIPAAEPMTGTDGSEYLLVTWLSIRDGLTEAQSTVCYSRTEGWCCAIPDTLSGNITAQRISEDDAEGIGTRFCAYDSKTGTCGDALWEIRCFTGEYRVNRAEALAMCVLAERDGTLFAGKLLPGGERYCRSENALKSLFTLFASEEKS